MEHVNPGLINPWFLEEGVYTIQVLIILYRYMYVICTYCVYIIYINIYIYIYVYTCDYLFWDIAVYRLCVDQLRIED